MYSLRLDEKFHEHSLIVFVQRRERYKKDLRINEKRSTGLGTL